MSIYLGTSKYSGSAGIAGGDASVIASNVTLSTSAQTYITVNNQGKTLQLPSAIPAGWLGSTASTAATGNHSHGHITSAGAVTQSGVAIDIGDSLLFVDSSNSSLIRKSSVTFPGNALVFLDGNGNFSPAPTTSVTYTPTVTSSTSGAYVMGTLSVNGTNTTLYGKDTTSSGGGGASYLGDLNDVSTTGATNGQALVYNGSSWAPSTVSGGGSAIQDLTGSTINIWSDLSEGIYSLPYTNTSLVAGNNTIYCYGGLLFVWTENTVKNWVLFLDASSSAAIPKQVHFGYVSSASTGDSYSTTFSTTNTGAVSVGHKTIAAAVTNLNTNSSEYYEPGITVGTLSTSVTGKPVNLTLSNYTAFSLFVNKNSSIGNVNASIRQDLYLPSLGKHYYRYCSRTSSTFTPTTTTPNCDSNGWVEEIAIPSYTSSDAGKALTVATGGASLQWSTVSGGGGTGADLSFYFDPEYDNITITESGNQAGLVTIELNPANHKRTFTVVPIGSSFTSVYTSSNLIISLDTSLSNIQNADKIEHYILVENRLSIDINVDVSSFNIDGTSADIVQADNTLNAAGTLIPVDAKALYGMVYNGTYLIVTFGGYFI